MSRWLYCRGNIRVQYASLDFANSSFSFVIKNDLLFSRLKGKYWYWNGHRYINDFQSPNEALEHWIVLITNFTCKLQAIVIFQLWRCFWFAFKRNLSPTNIRNVICFLVTQVLTFSIYSYPTILHCGSPCPLPMLSTRKKCFSKQWRGQTGPNTLQFETFPL